MSLLHSCEQEEGGGGKDFTRTCILRNTKARLVFFAICTMARGPWCKDMSVFALSAIKNALYIEIEDPNACTRLLYMTSLRRYLLIVRGFYHFCYALLVATSPFPRSPRRRRLSHGQMTALFSRVCEGKVWLDHSLCSLTNPLTGGWSRHVSGPDSPMRPIVARRMESPWRNSEMQ